MDTSSCEEVVQEQKRADEKCEGRERIMEHAVFVTKRRNGKPVDASRKYSREKIVEPAVCA